MARTDQDLREQHREEVARVIEFRRIVCPAVVAIRSIQDRERIKVLHQWLVVPPSELRADPMPHANHPVEFRCSRGQQMLDAIAESQFMKAWFSEWLITEVVLRSH